jgi:hypothetical protein
MLELSDVARNIVVSVDRLTKLGKEGSIFFALQQGSQLIEISSEPAVAVLVLLHLRFVGREKK